MQKIYFRWWYAFIGYGAFVLALVISSVLMSSTEGLFANTNFDKGSLFNLLMFVLAGVLCLLALRLVSRNQLTRDEFGIHFNRITVAVAVGSVLGVMFFGLSEAIEAHNQTLSDASAQVIQAFNLGENYTNDLLLVLSIGLFAPVAEEVVFRGAIFNSVAQGLKRYASIPHWLCFVVGASVSTLAFISIHGGGGQDAQLLLLGVLGVLAALAMYVTRSLFAAISVHAANNNMVFIYATSQQNDLETTHSAILIVTSVVCLLLCLPLGWLLGCLLPKK